MSFVMSTVTCGLSLNSTRKYSSFLSAVSKKAKAACWAYLNIGRIHGVKPGGCAYFDTHMSAEEGQRRAQWITREQEDPAYQAIRSTLPVATSYAGKKRI